MKPGLDFLSDNSMSRTCGEQTISASGRNSINRRAHMFHVSCTRKRKRRDSSDRAPPTHSTLCTRVCNITADGTWGVLLCATKHIASGDNGRYGGRGGGREVKAAKNVAPGYEHGGEFNAINF